MDIPNRLVKRWTEKLLRETRQGRSWKRVGKNTMETDCGGFSALIFSKFRDERSYGIIVWEHKNVENFLSNEYPEGANCASDAIANLFRAVDEKFGKKEIGTEAALLKKIDRAITKTKKSENKSRSGNRL